jgi:hypothetical protein
MIALEIVKENWNVWCHSGPNTPSTLTYWCLVMQHAYQQRENEHRKIRNPVYKIKNVKAQCALHCDHCTQPAAYAVYEGLHLYCEAHLPSLVA